MAFVAHARSDAPKWLRQGESFDPAPRGKSNTHACSLNKGIGCKSRTRKESLFSVCSLWIIECKGEGRIPKVAVFLKYCLPCRAICVRWKSVIGRAVMAPREGWSNAFVWEECLLHMNGSVRRPTNPETKNWQHSDSFLSAYLSIPLRSQEIQDTKAMVITIIVFWYIKFFSSLPGGANRWRRPPEQKAA